MQMTNGYVGGDAGPGDRSGGRAEWLRSTPDRLWVLIAAALIVSSTLAPFAFAWPAEGFLARITEASVWSTGGSLNLTAHLVVFLVFGVLIGAAYGEVITGRAFGRFVALVAVLCGALELLQLLQDSRHARVTDFLVNVIGIAIGAKLAGWPAPLRTRLLAWRMFARRRPARIHGLTFALITALWCIAGLRPLMAGGLLQMNWDENYRLVLANETDGSRPWLGELVYAGIYGRALKENEVVELYSGLNEGRSRDLRGLRLLAGYDFRTGPVDTLSPEGELHSEVLAIEADEGEWNAEGLLLPSPARLVSRGPASEMTKAIMASGAFSVEAWVRPASVVQDGPARIVSLSDGIGARNFTLGQEKTHFVFRVRNRLTGINGLDPQLEAKGATAGELQHLVAVYDHGVFMLYQDGRRLPEMLDLRDPSAIFSRASVGARAAIGVLLILGVGLPALGLLRRMTTRKIVHALVLALTFCIACLPYVAAILLVGGPWRLEYFLSVAAALIVAYPLALLCTDAARARPLARPASERTRTGRNNMAPALSPEP